MRFLPPKNRKPPTVIIVALIDVLLVVLIFMVVSTTFTNQAAVKLVLPESSQAKAAPAVNDSLIVTVAKEPPHFYFGTSAVAPADLEAELKQRIADNPELELSIRADTEAPWGQIIKLMDAAKATGITSVKAFTEEPADG
jgi:biopolymer transport protein ExbD